MGECGVTEMLLMLCHAFFLFIEQISLCLECLNETFSDNVAARGFYFCLLTKSVWQMYIRGTTEDLKFLSPSAAALSFAEFELYPHALHFFS